MDESWQRWDSILDTNDYYRIFSEHDNKSFEEEFEGENNSVDLAELSWENLHAYSCVTEDRTNDEILSSSLLLAENTTDFDVSSLIEHRGSAERPPKSCVLSFEGSTSVPCQHHGEHSKKIQDKPQNSKPLKRGRNSSQTSDHIIAERKRRETITRMFISLSALIPGLKRMDKATVLNNAVEYVKHLQQRVKDLEQENKKRKIESAGCFRINKTNNVADHEVLSWTFDDNPIKTCPKVKARVLGKEVLIRVTCEKQKNIVSTLLAKLEAHKLSIVCSNVLPFGNSSLNFTCIAKMDHEFIMTVDELVKTLTEDLLKCCNQQQ